MITDRHRRQRLVGVLVLVSLVLVTVDFRQGEAGPLHTARQLAVSVFAPLQGGLGDVVRPIGGFVAGIGGLGSLRREHEALQAELDALRAGEPALADLERENAELRAALALQERLQLTTTAAQVIGQPPDAFRWSVLIDVGSDDGVAPGMAVLNAEGLVGRVTDATGGHARVQLAASPTAGYAVRVADTGQQGLLEGRGSRPMELLLLDDVEAPVPVGSEVVTRAYQGGSVPDGIPLGVVASPGVSGEVRAELDVRPHVDFSRLGVVLVVRDTPALPVELEPDKAGGG
jgi:rod shape-determining protein MreC